MEKRWTEQSTTEVIPMPKLTNRCIFKHFVSRRFSWGRRVLNRLRGAKARGVNPSKSSWKFFHTLQKFFFPGDVGEAVSSKTLSEVRNIVTERLSS